MKSTEKVQGTPFLLAIGLVFALMFGGGLIGGGVQALEEVMDIPFRYSDPWAHVYQLPLGLGLLIPACFFVYKVLVQKKGGHYVGYARALVLVSFLIFWNELPAYSPYPPRAKVTELVMSGSAYMMHISEKFRADRNAATAGEGIEFTPVGNVTGGSVTPGGVITITGSTQSTSVGINVTVTLTPTYDLQTGDVSWQCDVSPKKYRLARCRGYERFTWPR